MTELERMLSGKLYIAQDEELYQKSLYAKKILQEFNTAKYDDFIYRKNLIKNLFSKTGENFIILPPLHCDYGCNISIGENFFANYDCIFLDVNKITIGDNVFLAPRVSLFTAGHPIDKDVRNEQLEYGYPITIGNDVWIGGNVTVNPGVTIGDNVVIGSGSVVTKDIPSNVVAAGNPCKVIRNITDLDKEYWNKQRELYYLDKGIKIDN